MGFEIPKEEVEKMKCEDFEGTFTYNTANNFWVWIQRNEKVDEDGNLVGLAVFDDGEVCKDWVWDYRNRNIKGRNHYRTLDDLVQDCDDEELLKLFLKEHCQ